MGSARGKDAERVVVRRGQAAGKSTGAVRSLARPIINIAHPALNGRGIEALRIGLEVLDEREGNLGAGDTAPRPGKVATRAGAAQSDAPAPTPLLDRILEELYNVHVRVVEQRQRVQAFADATVGALLETGSGEKRDQASGKVFEAIERLQDLHVAVTELVKLHRHGQFPVDARKEVTR